jgi:hypothetical protein
MAAPTPHHIKALVTQGNGQPLKVASVPFDANKLAPEEILVRVKAVGLNPTDWKVQWSLLALRSSSDLTSTTLASSVVLERRYTWRHGCWV